MIEPQPFAGKFAEQRARERADAIRWRLDQLRPQHRRRPIRRGHYHKFRNEQGGHLKITGPAA